MNGKIILVGAGPGCPGLMTLRGKQALETADVILYDRLVGDEIIAMIPETALMVDVGKSSGRHLVAQDQINTLLLEYARAGKTVVRLKGGDPYLFGRGAEELEAVVRENIPFEVVPGVTSATAVPAYAGIPVSHRDFSSSVHIITAHKKNGKAPDLDYKSLKKLGGTLVFLMGIGTIDIVTSGLIAAGMPADTPAALIENGTRPNQRKIIETLENISECGKAEEFAPPSILLVGSVCLKHKELDWFSQLPLYGKKIIVTRPEKLSTLSQKLRELGADVVNIPCIRTSGLPLPESMFKEIDAYDWIVFTSPTGSEIFFSRLKTFGIDIRTLSKIKIAAIGEKTALIFKEHGIYVDYMPDKYNARELGAGLPFDTSKENNRVLLFRAEAGTPQLVYTLRERGFHVDDAPVYKTIFESAGLSQLAGMLDRNEPDYLTFTSASTVQSFVATASEISLNCKDIKAICIGGETAAEAEKHGFKVIVSKKATIESMVEKLLEEQRC